MCFEYLISKRSPNKLNVSGAKEGGSKIGILNPSKIFFLLSDSTYSVQSKSENNLYVKLKKRTFNKLNDK